MAIMNIIKNVSAFLTSLNLESFEDKQCIVYDTIRLTKS